MDLWTKFVEAVAHEFRFLEAECGFICKATKPPFVIYESDRIQVLIYYDVEGRHELDLRIRKVGDDTRQASSIGIGMLMRLRKGPQNLGYVSPFPSTAAALQIEVTRLAVLLQEYGSSVIRDDLSDFDRIEELEQDLAEKLRSSEQSDSP
jgi:hypothetical protein